jgi:hypothetical protein
MPHAGASRLFSGGAVEVSILGLVAVLLIALGVSLFLNARQTAEERERRRRLMVNRIGRMGDATISDVRDDVVYYSYQVGGVSYTTSQDVSDLKQLLPPETSVLVGPAGLKYSPHNPANSIVFCENWSGLRPARAPLQFQESDIKEKSHT